ncbi:hypothetical protein PWEIH_11310 [Listeria weihenstephanensis FSL R9-0317]|uniref:Uncharacterized protein n=1 Tax=Listeria weihenstephanensis TaxID=1006155 RepID=A0A1S7FVB0_9LIST|nr:hypothetical protein UE46_09745 [Listeria weihenstephanensis]EUJ36747.1 hypothetical protein PWEIH_11310 [Listeria weihenstephanensis FSL R9-0317]
MDFSEAPKISRIWPLKLDHPKSESSPLASTEFVRRRSENPPLVFAEAPKIPRGWLLELDPKAQSTNKHRKFETTPPLNSKLQLKTKHQLQNMHKSFQTHSHNTTDGLDIQNSLIHNQGSKFSAQYTHTSHS